MEKNISKIELCLMIDPNETSRIIERKPGARLWHRTGLWVTPAIRRNHANPESDFFSIIRLVLLGRRFKNIPKSNKIFNNFI
jgi:hypothetical protein